MSKLRAGHGVQKFPEADPIKSPPRFGENVPRQDDQVFWMEGKQPWWTIEIDGVLYKQTTTNQ